MNLKTAKKLRRQARIKGVGLPNVQYLVDRTGAVRHHPNTVTGIYKSLKRGQL